MFTITIANTSPLTQTLTSLTGHIDPDTLITAHPHPRRTPKQTPHEIIITLHTEQEPPSECGFATTYQPTTSHPGYTTTQVKTLTYPTLCPGTRVLLAVLHEPTPLQDAIRLTRGFTITPTSKEQ